MTIRKQSETGLDQKATIKTGPKRTNFVLMSMWKVKNGLYWSFLKDNIFNHRREKVTPYILGSEINLSDMISISNTWSVKQVELFTLKKEITKRG